MVGAGSATLWFLLRRMEETGADHCETSDDTLSRWEVEHALGLHEDD